MFRTLRRWFLIVLLISAAGAIAFVGAFLQEFNAKDIDTLAKSLGLKLPLKEPRLEISVYRFVVELWDGDTMIKRYEAGFGRSQVPGRIGQDLASTPMGEYRVIKKDMREDIMKRGSRFMTLDYPNTNDARRALEVNAITRHEYDRIIVADREDRTPPFDTSLGGPLGIQGNFFFFRERHFTDGSVALSNADLNELFDYVPLGTPVLIHE